MIAIPIQIALLKKNKQQRLIAHKIPPKSSIKILLMELIISNQLTHIKITQITLMLQIIL